jgi:hypothetical protein
MQGAPVAESDGGWFKSSFSNQGGCVEVRLGSDVRVRDSKHRGGPELTFTPREWSAFLRGVENGEFNLRSGVDLSPEPDPDL